MKKNIILAMILCFFTTLTAQPKDSQQYALLTLKGSVNPIVAEHLEDSIAQANKGGASFIILEMDTPGGLLTSMRKIIQAILGSPIPVVVYTAPKGAQAASAGGFIMLSAHVGAMAPGTEIGAMHPVSPMLDFKQEDEKGRRGSGPMEKKVLNDTVAYARSLAQKRNRNVRWAERAVREAISNTYQEALRLNIIDIIAENRGDLLKQLNGRKVRVNGSLFTFNTVGATEKVFTMDWKQRFLNYFADPQIIFLLLIIAVAGLGIEFKNPGMIVPGAIGGISLFIFLMAIQVIPINVVGLLLILLAIVLFILELNVPSYGLLTLGGIASFVFGSMLLFDSPLPGGRVPLSTILGATAAILIIVFVVLRAIVKVHRSPVTTGQQALVGEEAVVLAHFKGKGKVMLRGEIWNALSHDSVEKDDTVIVSKVKGMVLEVAHKSETDEDENK